MTSSGHHHIVGCAKLICLQPGGTDVTNSLICLPVLPTRHSTHLQYFNKMNENITTNEYSTHFLPESSCWNCTTVIEKTHFSRFPSLSVA